MAAKAAKKEEQQQPVTHEQQAGPDELQQLIEFVRLHGLPILLGVVIAVGVVSIVNMYRRRARLTADSASSMLGKGMQEQDPDAKIAQLSDVMAQYPTAAAAPLALMAVAKAHFDNGKTDVAINKYIEFQSMYPEHPHAVGAELGRLHCLEAMRSTDTALQGFEAFLRQHGNHYLAPQAMLGKARCLVTMGRTNEAREVCEDLVVAKPDTTWSAKAERLIEQSKRKPRPMPEFAVPQAVDLSPPAFGPLATGPGQSPLVLPQPVPEKEAAPEKDVSGGDARQ
ncbi:tol-pal system YbgF family protein [Verrucomicrobiota bacterium]